jgi:hypothetical protein
MQIFPEGVSDYQLCAVGVIRYRDGNGVSRDTGFFRVLDPKWNMKISQQLVAQLASSAGRVGAL